MTSMAHEVVPAGSEPTAGYNSDQIPMIIARKCLVTVIVIEIVNHRLC